MPDLVQMEIPNSFQSTAPRIEGTAEPRDTLRGRITMERTMARRWNAWKEARGLLPILAALALWAWVLAGVMAPLGGTLATLGGARSLPTSAIACTAPDAPPASGGGAPKCP